MLVISFLSDFAWSSVLASWFLTFAFLFSAFRFTVAIAAILDQLYTF